MPKRNTSKSLQKLSPNSQDEFQKAPVILDAIKAELNRDLAPGRFVITDSTRFDALPATAQALTEDLFLVRRLDAWGRTLRARAAATPKVHILDSGVAARLMGVTRERLARHDSAALVEFGHLFETFVVGELLKQVSWTEDIAAVGHWRTHDGQEADLVVERADGSIVAIEAKAASRVDRQDAKGLRALRKTLGDGFLAGIVVNTGETSYRLEDRICVIPADRLWSL